jgi:hypothetical protein
MAARRKPFALATAAEPIRLALRFSRNSVAPRHGWSAAPHPVAGRPGCKYMLDNTFRGAS